MADRELGTIVRWLADKGFGFVKPVSGGPDCFLLWKDFDGYIPSVGDRISFVARMGDRGWRASAIEVMASDGR